jgi:phage protein D/phage baseplate assembly protein gpV
MPEEYAAKPRIEIDGTPLAHEYDLLLERVVVDDHLFLPDMFELRFRDTERTVLAHAGFKIGSVVKVLAGPVGKEASEPLITGEVTSLEAEFDTTGGHAVVRGYDHSHRLHRGRHTESYRDMTDSDIVKAVARRAGLDLGRIDATSITHPHVAQANLSDWDFLKARAREIGYELTVAGGKLDFRKPTPAADAPQTGDLASSDRLQLILGSNLESFHPRLTSAEQVKQVEVRGWDPSRKDKVVGSAPAATTTASLTSAAHPTTPAALAEKFGGPTYVAVDRPHTTQTEVDAVAKALAEQIAGASAEAEGTAKGDPRLKAGTPVSVGLAGDPFEGRYLLSATRHVFSSHEGYKTAFAVSGRQERSLLGLASLGATNGALSGSGPPIFGLVIGIVTSVKDPEKAGRVKLKFPWLSDTYESDWARLVVIGAGSKRGLLVLPEVDDEVLVGFEQGDIRRPYVLGGLYNGVDKPKDDPKLIDSSAGKVNRRWFMSRSGHLISFDDGSDGGGIVIETGNSKHALALSAAKSRVRITSSGDVVVEGGGKVTITAGADLSIEAKTKLELKAQQVSLTGDSNVEVKSNAAMSVEGTTVNVKGQASMDIEGGATCNVRAAMVKIN